jgi:hypothetical protein
MTQYFTGTQEVLHGVWGSSDNNVFAVGANGIILLYQKCDCTDSDSDGVPDSWDTCPDTPINSAVDSNGCVKNKVVVPLCD